MYLLPYLFFGRESINFNHDWKFIKDDPVNAYQISFDDSNWNPVQIPHDWAIEEGFDIRLPANTGKLPWKGVGWYRKHFDISSEYFILS